MPTRTVKTMAAVLTAGLCLGLSSSTNAQERPYPGLVRITDTAPPAPSADGVVDDAPKEIDEAPGAKPLNAPEDAASGETTDNVDGVVVSGEYTLDAYGNVVGTGVGYEERIQRTPVVYTHFYPQRWYGSPGPLPVSPAPMIYMPTDTTQLGYYYQQVPTWQPQPWRLPPGPTGYGGAYGAGAYGGAYGGGWEVVPGSQRDVTNDGTTAPSTTPPKPAAEEPPQPTGPAAGLYRRIR